MHFRFVVHTTYFQLHETGYIFFPTQMKQQLKSYFSLTNLLTGGWSDSDSPTQAEKSFHLLCICMKCSQMWSNTQWTEKKNKLKRKNNELDQNWKNDELTSTPKISKQPKDSARKMNIVFRKQERTARHKSNKNIMRLCFRKPHALYWVLFLQPLTELVKSRQPKGHKKPMCPEPVQVLLARAQGSHLIKKGILTVKKEISHTLCFTRNRNWVFMRIWDETQHQEKYYETLLCWGYKNLLSV